MKKFFFSILSAILLAASPQFYSYRTYAEAEKILTYSQNGYTLTLTIDDNNEAHIISCEGSGNAIAIPEIIGRQYPVSYIDTNAFSELDGLAAVIIPDSIKTIGSKNFQSCESLKEVHIGANVSEIGDYAFSACPSLIQFSVNSKNTSFSDMDGMLCSFDKKELVCYAGISSVVLPECIETVGKAAFFGRTDINSVELLNTISEICDYAFAGCLGLEKIKIPDSVKNLGKSSFMSCSELTSVSLGRNITEIPEDCFSMCVKLTSLELPESVTLFGDRAFYCCPELSGIYLSANVSSIGKDALGIHYDMTKGANAPVHDFCIFSQNNSAVYRYALESNVDFIDISNPPLGDVNNDKLVNAVDASCVLIEYSSVSLDLPPSFTQYQRIAGDYNRDGKTDAVDATFILIFYAENALK